MLAQALNFPVRFQTKLAIKTQLPTITELMVMLEQSGPDVEQTDIGPLLAHACRDQDKRRSRLALQVDAALARFCHEAFVTGENDRF